MYIQVRIMCSFYYDSDSAYFSVLKYKQLFQVRSVVQAVMKTMSYLKHMLSLEVQLDFNPHVILSLAWDQAPQWGRRQKTR